VNERLDISLAHRVTAPLLGERFQGRPASGTRSKKNGNAVLSIQLAKGFALDIPDI
jgi:hypothetical protein